MDPLIILAVTTEILLLAYCVAAWMLERRALDRFVANAIEPEELRKATKLLPRSYRAPAMQFAGDLARKVPLDEVVVQAVIKAANSPFAWPPLYRSLMGLGLTLLLFAPLAMALFSTAQAIIAAKASTPGIEGSFQFLAAKETIEPAFRTLHEACGRTAGLLAGISVIGAIHWWLNHPSAREARFIKALLEVAIIARPGASAPVGGRLSELIAPDRSLELPIFAFMLFCAAAFGGWSILRATAGVKEANASAVYRVWPDRATRALPTAGLRIPELSGGGSPLASFITMTIGQNILVSETELTRLDARGELPEHWTARAGDLRNRPPFIKGLGNLLRIGVVAGSDVSLRTVLSTLRYLKQTYDVHQFYLIFERPVILRQPNAPKIQAGLSFEIGDTLAASIAMEVSDSAVILRSGSSTLASVKLTGDWKQELMDAVRPVVNEARRNRVTPSVAITVDPRDMSYGELLAVLAAVDTTCPVDVDCGVPGLGLKFKISPE